VIFVTNIALYCTLTRVLFFFFVFIFLFYDVSSSGYIVSKNSVINRQWIPKAEEESGCGLDRGIIFAVAWTYCSQQWNNPGRSFGVPICFWNRNVLSARRERCLLERTYFVLLFMFGRLTNIAASVTANGAANMAANRAANITANRAANITATERSM